MSEPRESLRRVVIAGAGQVGVLAAIAMRRTMPTAEVIVVGLPPEPGALADMATTALPFTRSLHHRLGIADDLILARAQGSHRLVTRYFGWGGAGQSGAMAYGASVEPALRTRFAQEWGGGARNAAGATPPGSLAEVLADAGRFDPAAFPEIDFALRWNPDAYHALLVEVAQALGVVHVAATIAGIEPDGAGGIASLALEGAGTLAADLFIDCSGPSARLYSALPDFKQDDWSGALPLRRLILARPQPGLLALEDRATLLAEGWLTETAGADALRMVLGVAPDVPEEAALRALGAPPMVGFALEQGAAARPWLGNVVAIGDAAARFEPLGHLNLDLAHRQIDLLLELLPGRIIEPMERGEYNRRAGLMAAAVRDTLTAHYAAPAARERFGAAAVSPELARMLDQFERRGRMPFREETALERQEMQSLLAALGLRSGEVPQARAADHRSDGGAAQRFARDAQAALAGTLPYAAWRTTIGG